MLTVGGKVYLLDATITDPLITKVAFELQQTKPMLRPDILGGAEDDNEREALAGFLIGCCGVQKLDAKTVCREVEIIFVNLDADGPVADGLGGGDGRAGTHERVEHGALAQGQQRPDDDPHDSAPILAAEIRITITIKIGTQTQDRRHPCDTPAIPL
jgi:hypothetical protein